MEDVQISEWINSKGLDETEFDLWNGSFKRFPIWQALQQESKLSLLQANKLEEIRYLRVLLFVWPSLWCHVEG